MNELPQPLINFVLVNTTHAGNIGAAARAMKTMGFASLRLVNPCRYQTAESLARASGADSIVRNADVFSSLPEAIADCHQVYGTSARSRSLEWTVVTARDAANSIAQSCRSAGSSDNAVSESQVRIALVFGRVFGRERSGLTNEELDLCQHRLWIPTDPDFSSLNLGSAVQVVAYELALAIQTVDAALPESDEPLADAAGMARFYQHLEETLVSTGFLDPDNPRHLMRRLRRYFGRNQPSESELSIFRGILSSVNRLRS